MPVKLYGVGSFSCPWSHFCSYHSDPRLTKDFIIIYMSDLGVSPRAIPETMEYHSWYSCYNQIRTRNYFSTGGLKWAYSFCWYFPQQWERGRSWTYAILIFSPFQISQKSFSRLNLMAWQFSLHQTWPFPPGVFWEMSCSFYSYCTEGRIN